MFFESNLMVVNSPRLPRISPRSYQRKTTPKHPLFSKHPSKSLAKTIKKPRSSARFFLANYGFFRIALPAIAVGELPAGSIVKHWGKPVPVGGLPETLLSR